MAAETLAVWFKLACAYTLAGEARLDGPSSTGGVIEAQLRACGLLTVRVVRPKTIQAYNADIDT